MQHTIFLGKGIAGYRTHEKCNQGTDDIEDEIQDIEGIGSTRLNDDIIQDRGCWQRAAVVFQVIEI